MFEVGVSIGFLGEKVKAQMALPLDLIESVDVQEVYLKNLSSVQEKVLKLVENDQSVLLITHDLNGLVQNIKSEMPKDNFIVHCSTDPDEDGARDWICGKSSKKFLIVDRANVDGYEADTVLIVIQEVDRSLISNLCQRAKGKLVICVISSNFLQKMVVFSLRAFAHNPKVICLAFLPLLLIPNNVLQITLIVMIAMILVPNKAKLRDCIISTIFDASNLFECYQNSDWLFLFALIFCLMILPTIVTVIMEQFYHAYV